MPSFSGEGFYYSVFAPFTTLHMGRDQLWCPEEVPREKGSVPHSTTVHFPLLLLVQDYLAR